MGWKNTEADWGRLARWLHWGFAIAILIEVIAGFVMSRTFGSRDPQAMQWQYWSSNLHHTGGMLLLAAAFARLGWRFVSPIPATLAVDSPAQAKAARGVHWLLYALLLLIPLSGWASLSSLADSPAYGRTILWFFGTNGSDINIPRIVPPVPWDSDAIFRYSTFARSHRWLLVAGAVLLSLHIVAALFHHFVLKDRTLRRMWGRVSP